MPPLPHAHDTEPTPPRPYAEFRVGFVIAHAVGLDRSPRARLDGVERTLTNLIRRWHTRDRLSAARDVRMSPETLDEVLSWVERDGSADHGLLERLAVYHSGAVADATVPRGWIRVYVGVGLAGPGLQRAGEG